MNWLRSFRDGVISPFQASFILGWSTTDNIIIIQKLTHTIRRKRSKNNVMALKIDLAKAYDCVD